MEAGLQVKETSDFLSSLPLYLLDSIVAIQDDTTAATMRHACRSMRDAVKRVEAESGRRRVLKMRQICARLELLAWARSQGCPWNRGTCEAAAACGSLEGLKWLRANGCPWDSNTCLVAMQAGHLAVYRWAVKSGCPYTAGG
eukprot:scaffold659976_cov41-Prasinocladus_malaysianus.AAC.1